MPRSWHDFYYDIQLLKVPLFHIIQRPWLNQKLPALYKVTGMIIKKHQLGNIPTQEPSNLSTPRHVQTLMLHSQFSPPFGQSDFCVHAAEKIRKYKYSGCHQKVYKCCFMKQNCHFQRGVLQYKNAIMPLNSLAIHTTHQHFQRRYITLLFLKGLKSYWPKLKCKVWFTKEI